jgi:DNA primase
MWLRTIGVDAMAIHGERHMYTKEQMELLRAKYKRIVSLYDNDWAGMRGGLKLREKWGCRVTSTHVPPASRIRLICI